MSLIKRIRKQTAVYWPPLPADQFGQVRFGEPQEIDCRWEQGVNEKVDTETTTKVANCRVYVENELQLGGRLAKGSLADLKPVDLKPVPSSLEIISVNELPNLKATETLRWVLL